MELPRNRVLIARARCASRRLKGGGNLRTDTVRRKRARRPGRPQLGGFLGQEFLKKALAAGKKLAGAGTGEATSVAPLVTLFTGPVRAKYSELAGDGIADSQPESVRKGSKTWFDAFTPWKVNWATSEGKNKPTIKDSDWKDKQSLPGAYVLSHEREAYGEAMDMLIQLAQENGHWVPAPGSPAGDALANTRVDQGIYVSVGPSSVQAWYYRQLPDAGGYVPEIVVPQSGTPNYLADCGGAAQWQKTGADGGLVCLGKNADRLRADLEAAVARVKGASQEGGTGGPAKVNIFFLNAIGDTVGAQAAGETDNIPLASRNLEGAPSTHEAQLAAWKTEYLSNGDRDESSWTHMRSLWMALRNPQMDINAALWVVPRNRTVGGKKFEGDWARFWRAALALPCLVDAGGAAWQVRSVCQSRSKLNPADKTNALADIKASVQSAGGNKLKIAALDLELFRTYDFTVRSGGAGSSSGSELELREYLDSVDELRAVRTIVPCPDGRVLDGRESTMYGGDKRYLAGPAGGAPADPGVAETLISERPVAWDAWQRRLGAQGTGDDQALKQRFADYELAARRDQLVGLNPDAPLAEGSEVVLLTGDAAGTRAQVSRVIDPAADEPGSRTQDIKAWSSEVTDRPYVEALAQPDTVEMIYKGGLVPVGEGSPPPAVKGIGQLLDGHFPADGLGLGAVDWQAPGQPADATEAARINQGMRLFLKGGWDKDAGQMQRWRDRAVEAKKAAAVREARDRVLAVAVRQAAESALSQPSAAAAPVPVSSPAPVTAPAQQESTPAAPVTAAAAAGAQGQVGQVSADVPQPETSAQTQAAALHQAAPPASEPVVAPPDAPQSDAPQSDAPQSDAPQSDAPRT